jgi:hypothetical protein
MKLGRRSLTVSLAFAFAFVGCRKLQEDKVQTRVANVLNGIMAEGGTTGDKLNFAMLEWDGGQGRREGLAPAGVYDRFTGWCQKNDINRQILGWEVTGIEIVDEHPLSAVVSVTIEGKRYRMNVTEHERITWLD